MTIEELRRLPRFAEVSEAAIGLLAPGFVERSYPAGSVIWRQGTPATALYVLLAGTACAMRSRAGRETVVHRAHAGDTVGEIPFFDGGPMPASLVAESPVRMLILDGKCVRAALHADGTFAVTFLETLGQRVRELAERLEARMAEPVRVRLARHLIHRSRASTRPDFDLGMTQTQLAHDLGTVREVLARQLGHLVKRGMLERTGRGRFRIVERGRLEGDAEGG